MIWNDPITTGFQWQKQANIARFWNAIKERIQVLGGGLFSEPGIPSVGSEIQRVQSWPFPSPTLPTDSYSIAYLQWNIQSLCSYYVRTVDILGNPMVPTDYTTHDEITMWDFTSLMKALGNNSNWFRSCPREVVFQTDTFDNENNPVEAGMRAWCLDVDFKMKVHEYNGTFWEPVTEPAPPDVLRSDLPQPDSCTEFYQLPGDYFHPKLFEQLRDAFNMLIWTLNTNNTWTGEHRYALEGNDYTYPTPAEVMAATEAEWATAGWIPLFPSQPSCLSRVDPNGWGGWYAELGRVHSKMVSTVPALFDKDVYFFLKGASTSGDLSGWNTNGDNILYQMYRCWSSVLGVPAATTTVESAVFGGTARPLWRPVIIEDYDNPYGYYVDNAKALISWSFSEKPL